jgi:hypothetical protein
MGGRRKAAVVTAVRSGAISLEEACGRYELSEEECHAWERGIDIYGVAGCESPGCKSSVMRLSSGT